MSERDTVERFLKNHPHHHQTFFARPYVSRRQFFEILGAGVTGSYLLPRLKAGFIHCEQREPTSTPSAAPICG